MSVSCASIFSRAADQLNDTDDDNRRWPDSELFDHLCAGQNEIVLLKNDAYVLNTEIQLVEGTLQSLPVGGISLISMPRNMGADGSTPGKAIRRVDQARFSRRNPSWHMSTASADVRFFMFDPRDPSRFWVYPPQPSDSPGYVTLIYSASPPDPEVGEPADYNASITLGDIYENVLLDYILYRAWNKDAADSMYAARSSQAHYNQFVLALGRKDLAERASQPLEPYDSEKGK